MENGEGGQAARWKVDGTMKMRQEQRGTKSPDGAQGAAEQAVQSWEECHYVYY